MCPASSAPHETVQPGTRRRFTPAEKLRVVTAAEAAIASGERGALAALRKEGIYSLHLAAWRRLFAANGEAGWPRTGLVASRASTPPAARCSFKGRDLESARHCCLGTAT